MLTAQQPVVAREQLTTTLSHLSPWASGRCGVFPTVFLREREKNRWCPAVVRWVKSERYLSQNWV